VIPRILALTGTLLGILASGEDLIKPVQPESTGAALAAAIRNAGLDAESCYRVRDLGFSREDLRFYLTEGYIIFGKPVDGRVFSAVFVTSEQGGDAEVIVMPPNRSERASLARYTESPNLDEHFSAGVFLFSDDTNKELLEQIQSGSGKAAPDKGMLMVGQWEAVVKNLTGSVDTRLVQDQLSKRTGDGLFHAIVTGRKLNNFDLVYDPQAPEQIAVGQLVLRENRLFFNVWTSFPGRSYRNGRKQPFRDGISLKDFRIEAELQPDLMLKAVTRMTLVTERPLAGAVGLELSRRMHITAASLDGQALEVLERESLRSDMMRAGDNGTVLFMLRQPLEPGRSYEIEIKHEGSVVMPAGNDVYFVSARTNWYPNHSLNFTLYDMRFRYPKNLNLVANGDIGEDTTDGDWRITHRRTSAPIRFAGFNLGDYTESSTEREGCTIRVYANRKLETALRTPSPPASLLPKGRDKDAPEALPQIPFNSGLRVQQLTQEIGGAFEFMAGHFGPPPLKTLTVSPIPGTFGQGFPGLLYLSTLSFLDPRDRPLEARREMEQMFFSDILHAHETAHQWWGNLVTAENAGDDWLMEALANYSALLYLEKRKGRKALDMVLDQYRDHLLVENKDKRSVESAGPIVWGLRLSSSEMPGAWRIITYEKGSWILHMLRGQMGDEAFLKMLGQLVSRYRYQGLTTASFQKVAAEFMPPKYPDRTLEAFFDQWVYGTGVPKLTLAYRVSGNAPAAKVQGTVTQSDVDEDFSALVPIQVQVSARRTLTEWVRTSGDPASFTVATETLPSKVALDPANVILKR
jgi:hypothetical protein